MKFSPLLHFHNSKFKNTTVTRQTKKRENVHRTFNVKSDTRSFHHLVYSSHWGLSKPRTIVANAISPTISIRSNQTNKLVAEDVNNRIENLLRDIRDQVVNGAQIPSADLYDIITTLSRAPNATDSQYTRFVNEILRLSSTGELPTKITLGIYNTTISGFGSRGLFKEMLHTFHAMLQAGVVPDNTTFTHMIRDLGIAGDLATMIDVFKYMQQLRIEPDKITLTVLISSFAKAKQIEPMIAIYELLTRCNKGVDVAVYNALLTGFRDMRDTARLQQTFEEMIKNGITPDAVSYNIVLSHFVNVGNLARMKVYLDRMLVDRVPWDPMILKRILQGYASAGDTDSMEEWFNKTVQYFNVDITTDIINIMIKAHGAKGDYVAANKYFTMMKVHGVRPDIDTFSALIHTFGKAGHTDKMIKIYEALPQYNLNPTLGQIHTIMSVFLYRRDYESVLCYFNQAKILDLQPNQLTFGFVMAALEKKRDYDLMMDYVREMRTLKITPTAKIMDHFDRLWCSTAESFLLQGKLLEVVGLWNSPDRLAVSRSTTKQLLTQFVQYNPCHPLASEANRLSVSDNLSYQETTNFMKSLEEHAKNDTSSKHNTLPLVNQFFHLLSRIT